MRSDRRNPERVAPLSTRTTGEDVLVHTALSSDGHTKYQIYAGASGVLYCSCLGFSYRKYCRHIQEVPAAALQRAGLHRKGRRARPPQSFMTPFIEEQDRYLDAERRRKRPRTPKALIFKGTRSCGRVVGISPTGKNMWL